MQKKVSLSEIVNLTISGLLIGAVVDRSSQYVFKKYGKLSDETVAENRRHFIAGYMGFSGIAFLLSFIVRNPALANSVLGLVPILVVVGALMKWAQEHQLSMRHPTALAGAAAACALIAVGLYLAPGAVMLIAHGSLCLSLGGVLLESCSTGKFSLFAKPEHTAAVVQTEQPETSHGRKSVRRRR